jgi:hypothetical protein
MYALSSGLFLIFLMSITSCQVKQGAVGDGLISGHLPVVNTFKVNLPASKYYQEGNVLSFTLTHPFSVTVTGTPLLALTIGGSSVSADYVSGSGTNSLIFSYTVQSGDTDTDGITIDPTLDLNGGTITFNTTENASLALSVPSTSGIKVDTTSPTITTATPPAVNHFYSGTRLLFQVTYDEAITVTGSPSIDLTFNECTVAGAQTKKANYYSGSGTNTLSFSYTVENTCNETTGGMPILTSIQLNGGTLKDQAGHTAPVDFSGFISSPIANGTEVRGRYPAITNVIPPANGTYGPGSTLNFKLLFDRAVTVSPATSYFNFKIGTDAAKQAAYLSGSGTTELTFSYTVIGGDADADGVEITSGIVNEGTICSGAFCLVNGETDILPTNTYSGVIVSAPIPMVTAIQIPSPLPATGYYKLGDTVQVVVAFSEAVTVSGGTPLLTSVVGSTSRDFEYLGGSGTANLIFTYTIQDTDLDTDGVNFTSPVFLNGATIQNSQGTNADLDFTYTVNTGFRFDGVAPTIISSVINGAVATNHPDYRLNQYVYIDLTFSEAVTVTGSTIGISVGGVARTASYVTNVSPTVKRYRYRIQSSDHLLKVAVGLDVGTTLTAGTIQDVALNDISDRTIPATDTTGVEIDGAVPTVTSVTLPADGTYKQGATVSFTVNFSEAVNVTGTPKWTMTLDAGGPESLSYVSGTGSSALVFEMTVDSNDVDLTGIAVATSFTLTGATISDASVGNPLTNSIPAQSTSGIKLDGQGPTVSNITGPASGTYIDATNLDFTVTYSEAVTITGSPELTLNIGGTTKYASYLSGSGTSSVVYRYIVETGLSDTDGVQVTSHILNSGTITDIPGNNATLTITTYSFGTAFVDSQGPQILSITPPANGVKVSGDTLSFTVTFDEAVTVAGGTPSLALNIGGVVLKADYASGTGTKNLVFTTGALTTSHFDPGGIAYDTNTLSLNGATMQDTYNYDANLSFTAGSLSGIKVIYSEVLSWIQVSTSGVADGGTIASLSDSSPSGNNASSNAGIVTKISNDVDLNNLPSADFDGLSSLVMGSLSVKTIAVVFKARTVSVSAKVVADASFGVTLVNPTDLSFGANARYAVDGGTLSGALSNSCNNCYDNTTTKVVMIHYQSNQNITALLGDNFDGKIAEIWLLSGTQSLTNAQVEKIGTYLASKY